MIVLHIAVERDRDARSSHDGARFRVRVGLQPGPSLLSSTRALQSVARAQLEAESIFGPLEWRPGAGDIRFSAILDLEFD